MPDSRTQRPKRLLIARQQSVRAVLWALDTFGARLRPKERPFVGYLCRRLAGARNVLTRGERQLRRRETVRHRLVRRRNGAAKELRVLMVAGRGLTSHLFGDDKLEAIGFARRIEEDPEALLEQAVAVVGQVGDPGFVLPTPRLKGLSVDLRDLAVDLVPAIEKLRDALEKLQAARCDVTLALHDRNVALEAFNHDFLHIARIVEGLLRRANLDDLADRVRPSTRRRGLTRVPFVEEDAVPPAAEEDEDAATESLKPKPAHPVVGHPHKTLSGVRPRETIAPP